MQLEHLFDPASAAIVVGGTLLATVLRCGWSDCRTALAAMGGLGGRRFDAALARAELAGPVREMRRDGVIRAHPHHFGDAEFDEATDALIGSRSLEGLHKAHLAHKRRRTEQSRRAVRTFTQAADLAPEFGLAGTLISLSQLPAGSGSGGDFAAAISMAVLTTLYGLLLGNIVFAPLARMVARAAAAEERERHAVIEWLEHQVEDALPRPRAGHAPHERAAS